MICITPAEVSCFASSCHNIDISSFRYVNITEATFLSCKCDKQSLLELEVCGDRYSGVPLFQWICVRHRLLMLRTCQSIS